MSHGGALDAFIQAFDAPLPSDAALRDMRMDSLRIVNRLQILREPTRLSYIPPNVQQQIRVITDEHDTIMTQWLPPVRPGNLSDSQKIAAHTGRIATALNQLLPIFNTWGQPPLRDIIGEQIAADGRIDRGCAAWTHILSLDQLLLTTSPQLTTFLTQQLAAWRRPRLRTWLNEAGLDAANGYLRIVQLGAFAGKSIHLSLYIANIDLEGDLSITDPVDNVLATLLPDVDSQWRGTHVTFELFAQDDFRNPKFFKPNNFRFNNDNAGALADIQTDANAVRDHLRGLLANEIARIRQLLNAFIAKRNNGLH